MVVVVGRLGRVGNLALEKSYKSYKTSVLDIFGILFSKFSVKLSGSPLRYLVTSSSSGKNAVTMDLCDDDERRLATALSRARPQCDRPCASTHATAPYSRVSVFKTLHSRLRSGSLQLRCQSVAEIAPFSSLRTPMRAPPSQVLLFERHLWPVARRKKNRRPKNKMSLELRT